MKKVLALIVVAAIAVFMTQTVPDKKAHKEAMMKAVREYVDEEATERGLADNGVTRAGKKLVSKAIEGVLGAKLKVNDYYLFNTTSVKLGDESKTLSVGMFGKVFTFDKEMLRDALEEAAAEKKEAKELKKQQKEDEKRLKKELKQQKRAAKKAEREARKAAKKAEKEARKAAKNAEKER